MTMPERSLLSRLLRAFGRLLRRLTIMTGALILILYFSGDWILAAWPIPPVRNGQNRVMPMPGGMLPRSWSTAASSGSSTGNICSVCGRRRMSPANFSSASSHKDSPALRWLDDDRLQVDLGRVSAISPQIEKAGPVRVTFTYSGADPSLD